MLLTRYWLLLAAAVLALFVGRASQVLQLEAAGSSGRGGTGAAANPSAQHQFQLHDPYLLHDTCASVLNEQIGWELYASMVYLNMAGYFDRPTVGKLGYARFFKEQSQEEYEHAKKIMDYINERNATVKNIAINESPKNEWNSPREAVSDAITLEKHVYAKLQHIHNVAEQQCLDAHLTDFLEGVYFTEQVRSIAELQTMLSKLGPEPSPHAHLLEYFEDSRLRSKEPHTRCTRNCEDL